MVPSLSHDGIKTDFARYLLSNRKLEQFFTITPNIQSYPDKRGTEGLACPVTGINGPGVNTEG